MDEQLIEELSDVPGWDGLVAAGAVAAPEPRVLEKLRSEVRDAAENERLNLQEPRHSHRRWWLSAAALATAATVAGLLVLAGRGPHEQPAAAPANPPANSTPRAPVGSCVELYSLTNLAHRGLAFDGTVERISAIDEPAGAKIGRLKVTFAVNQWFRGGTANRVTVITSGSGSDLEAQVHFQTGTRLLVSGENQPPADSLAWTGCGFTRPYDESTAAAWQSVLKK